MSIIANIVFRERENKMIKYYKHFKTVCKHKYFVFKECVACVIWWKGIIHDFSKFGFTEFISSAKHFQGNRSPIEAEKEEIGYSKAWLHHKGHNKHHWEYWTDFSDDGSIIANEIPYKYVVEMVCDWIGAGKAYSKDKWTQADPINYFNAHRKGRYFHPNTEKLLITLQECIRDNGLKAFHDLARQGMKKEL